MSVYTKITDGELESHLENYSLGKIRNFSGISEGIENSNYLLNTETGDFIFTIFEAISADRVVDYLSFMNHINSVKMNHQESFILLISIEVNQINIEQEFFELNRVI